MLADPTPPPASIAPRDTAVPPIEAGQILALIAALADGETHAVRTIATRLVGRDDDDTVAAVAGALEVLRDAGLRLEIDRDTVRARRFAVLDEATIGEGLPHWHATVVGATTSTNSDLLAVVRRSREAAIPRLLACELQTGGRGRLGRRWTSAPGGSLTMSVALRVARPLAALDGATLVCGLAVLDVVCAHGVAAALKWPNDLIVGDRKLCGILVEAHAAGAATTVVVGVGLNVERVDPVPAAGLSAIGLADCGGSAIDRNRLAVAIALALERRLGRFSSEGFAPFVDEWNAADGWRDRAVCLRSAGGAAADGPCGIARGIDATGALRLDVDGRIEPVIAGDLSLRAAATVG